MAVLTHSCPSLRPDSALHFARGWIRYTHGVHTQQVLAGTPSLDQGPWRREK